MMPRVYWVCTAVPRVGPKLESVDKEQKVCRVIHANNVWTGSVWLAGSASWRSLQQLHGRQYAPLTQEHSPLVITISVSQTGIYTSYTSPGPWRLL